MINVEDAERIVKSRYRFSIFLLLVVGALSWWIIQQSEDIRILRSSESLKRSEIDSIHRIELKERDKIIQDCEERDRIFRDNALKAKQADAEEYKKLYLKTVELREAYKNTAR